MRQVLDAGGLRGQRADPATVAALHAEARSLLDAAAALPR